MMSALSYGNHWLECLQIASRLRPLSHTSTNALLTALQRCAQWAHVLDLFLNSSYQADAIGSAACIAAYGSAHRWQEALELYQSTKNKNVILLNVAISACAESFQWPSALELLSNSCDVVSYNSAITACGLAEEWQQALKIFAHMPRKDVKG